MKNVYLFQPQFHGKADGITRAWLPYSVGCLWAYAVQFPDIAQNWNVKKFYFKRDKFETILAELEEPAFCGFSTYQWNEKYNLGIAKLIKERWPNCFISFGGPQASLTDYFDLSFIDQIVPSEGEETFVDTLRAILSGKSCERTPAKKRMPDLNNVPSPYSSGVFDNLIKENPDCYFSAVLETNRGCPFHCTFCDWGSLTYSKIKKFDLSRVEQDLIWFTKNRVINIAIADANFGIFAERDMEVGRMVKEILTGSCVDYVGMTFTKNTTEETFKIAAAMMPFTKAVTMSMQSMHEDTLKAVKRDNLKMNNMSKQIKFADKYNIPSYSEMILGLPEESLESWKTGLGDLLEAGQHHQIELYPAILIRNSEMNNPATRFQYKIKSIEVCDFIQYSTQEDDTQEPLKEVVDMVVSTSTMSTPDMIESHCYSWSLINTHIAGHSQIIAKYCRNVLDVPYRKFYDAMHDRITTGNEFSEEYNVFKQAQIELFTKGHVSSLPGTGLFSLPFHLIHYHFVNFYMKKDLASKIALEVGRQFGQIPKDVIQLQSLFVYDNNQRLPQVITIPWNLDDWQEQESQYQVTGKIKHLNINQHNIIWNRKQGTLKNKIELVQ